MASETPAAWAISLVVVPRKPRLEKRLTATRRICRRRSSPAIRALFGAHKGSVGVLIGLLTLGLFPLLHCNQSKYLLTTRCQSCQACCPAPIRVVLISILRNVVRTH